jgi:phosphoglycerate dehydrogenase-like enzyme
MLDQPTPCAARLREAGFEVRYPRNKLLARGLCSERETIDELRGASAVVAGGETFSARVLSALPQLRVIARAGVGFDRVDVQAATARRIAVTITPTSNHEAVAEHALALIFAVAKSIVLNDKRVRAGNWTRVLMEPIRRQKLGILGLGRIGKSLAVRAVALGMQVLATETMPDHAFVRQQQIELVSLDELLGSSDYLSLHCPLNDQTRGIINRQTLAKMKHGGVLINTSRGGLVVEADLVQALRSGHLRAAALDVFEQEPPSPDNPLFELENVVVTPHLAGTDQLSMEAMGTESAENIIKLYQGQWPEGAVVNEELRAAWEW